MGADWTLHPWHHNSSNVGGVTAGQARHNSCNFGGVTAGQVWHNSSNNNHRLGLSGRSIECLRNVFEQWHHLLANSVTESLVSRMVWNTVMLSVSYQQRGCKQCHWWFWVVFRAYHNRNPNKKMTNTNSTLILTQIVHLIWHTLPTLT